LVEASIQTAHILVCERSMVMRYFVKNLKVHKHPKPKKCKVQYTGETLHSSPPDGYEKCDDCFDLPR
jgi:hypothetical protein